MLADNTPVIVGAGQLTERPESESYQGLSNVELATEACRLALADALGESASASIIDTVAALRTFEHTSPQYRNPFGKSNNFPHSIAHRLQISPAHAIWARAGGDTPQTLCSELCERIHLGEVGTAVLVGAEAISTARHLAGKEAQVDWSEEIDAPVDDRGLGLRGLRMRYATQHKIMGGPDSYALLENARRHRLGMAREDYLQSMAALFAPFSEVAAHNPHAFAPQAYTAAELSAVTERNRMIAEPYPRLLVARDQVNQAAAVILTSVGRAREMGIPESKWVFLHGYAAAQERPIQYRESLGQALSAPMSCQQALAAAGIGVDDINFFDFYSCFPIAVSNVCEVLGIAPDDPRGLTVTGGLPYFGGPGNSYSLHALVSLVDRLRENPGSYGLLGANGGQLSKYAAGVYSSKPKEFRACDSSALQAQIDANGPRPVAFEADGPGRVETYTVVYGKEGPSYGILVGTLTESGERFFANTTDGDTETLQALIASDPLGREVHVRSFGFGNRFAFSEEKLRTLFPDSAPRFRENYEFIKVERRGHVLEVTMNRPEMRNALHPPAHEELDEIFDAYFADPDLWVAIITGAGKDSFTAGNDLKYSAKHPVYLPKNGFGALTRRGNKDKPIIAAVNGFAVGGGLEICLACDLVVADAKSQFGLTEVRVGLVAGEGGLVRLPRRISPLLANEMILTGRRLKVEEARAAGLVNRVTPDGEALQGARELADEILEGSPTSVRASLRIMRATESIADELAAVRWKHPAIDDLMSSEDAMEGPQAFAQKRKPRWKNR